MPPARRRDLSVGFSFRRLRSAPRLLNAEANGSTQFLTDLINLPLACAVRSRICVVQLSHARVESRLRGRLLLQQEFHCSLEIHPSPL